MARNRTLAGVDLDRLKFQVAQELAPFPDRLDNRQFQATVDRMKFELARELGIDLRPGYNGDIRARDAGRIGGKIGGPIGGPMVRHLIRLAEEQLAQRGTL